MSAVVRAFRQFDTEDGLVTLLASVVVAAREFIGIADLDGRALFVNEAGRKLVGLSDLQAVRATRIVDYFTAADQPRVLEQVMPAVRSAGFWQGKLEFRNFATGQPVPVLYNIFSVRDATGAIAGYGTVTRHLTTNELAARPLRYLAAIVESSDDAIVSKDLDGIITSWNGGAERIFGYSAGEVIGRSITILIPEERQNEEAEILAKIKSGLRVDHFETVRRRKDGSRIAVSLTISPVKDDAGEIIGASKIARDVTEQKRIQQQIATLAREAEHRSKNLLASVRAILHLSRSDTPEGLKQALEGRFRALDNVNSLFVETRWTGAKLSAIAVQELAPYSANDQKRVHIDGEPIFLESNAAQALAVIVHELATNAAKYGGLSRATGRISLTWQRTGDRLVIRWIEKGGPAVQKPGRKGFGSRVITQMIGQVGGEVRFDWRPEGLACEIVLPM